MRVAHIVLDTSDVGSIQAVPDLIQALSRHGLQQTVLSGDTALIRRLRDVPRVTIGPTVQSPIMACCLMPEVDVAHVHDLKSAQTGLLLTLTRSIPYLITEPSRPAESHPAILRNCYRRAKWIVCQTKQQRVGLRSTYPDSLIEIIPEAADKGGSTERAAAAYVRLYRQITDSGRLPALMI